MDTQDLLYLSLHLQQETKRPVLVSHLLSLAKWGRSGGSLPLKEWLVFEIMRNFDLYDTFFLIALICLNLGPLTDRSMTSPHHNVDPDISECSVMGRTDLGHVADSHLITLL